LHKKHKLKENLIKESVLIIVLNNIALG